MNEIYAINPFFLNSEDADSLEKDREIAKDLILLFGKFGMSEGRFIAEYPVEWSEWFKVELNKLNDTHRSRLEIMLAKRLADGIIGVQDPYLKSKDWIENAVNAKLRYRNISSVITHNNLGVRDVLSINDVLYSSELKDSRGGFIRSEISSYKKILTPLFFKSTELHLQDMHFHFEDYDNKKRMRRDVLRMFVELAVMSKRCKRIFLHLNSRKHPTRASQDNLKNELAMVIKDLGAQNFSFEPKLVDPMDSHGRYIFGIKGGLQFDQGFDAFGSGKTNNLRWLSSDELTVLCQKYGI